MAPTPDLEDGNEIDRDDSALDTSEMPYEALMAMLKGDDDTGGDDEAFGKSQPVEAKESDVVSIEDGIDLIDQAGKAKADNAKVDTAPEEKPEGDKPAPAKTEGEDPTLPPADQPDDLDALLGGLDETARTTIKDRVKGADEVLAIFKGREAELQSLGVTPVQAMSELVKINAYARKAPDQYLAWAATQFGDPADVLGKAAQHLGLKVVPIEGGDDDPFEDPEVKAMKAELARYKQRDQLPALGPDAPQNRAMDELQAFQATATHFQTVAPQIAALAKAHVETKKTPATMDDIKRFYNAAVVAAGLDTAPAQVTPAAQAQQPVAQQAQKTEAAKPSDSVARAKAASKSLDGSGQGAGRRPALDKDMTLEQTLHALYAAQTGG